MKNYFKIFVFLFVSIQGFAQVPAYFNYQAAIRDDDGSPLKEQLVGLKISVLEGSENGNTVYVENHQLVTSASGVINLLIGNGQNQLGNLKDISWESNEYWLSIELDKVGGSDYVFMNSSRLVSVPYALHAKKADEVENIDDADADPENEIQYLILEGNEISITYGNSIELPNNNQTLLDNDPENEIQDLTATKNGNLIDLEITRGGQGTTLDISDNDSDAQNEIQNLSLNGDSLSISDGNTILLPGSSSETFWSSSSTWNPYGIYYWGNVYMDTVDIAYRLKIGNNNPHGTEIYDRDFFMNNNEEMLNLQMSPDRLRFNNNSALNYSVFNKDSLLFFNNSGGILGHEITRLSYNGLTHSSADHYSVLDAYKLEFSDYLTQLMLANSSIKLQVSDGAETMVDRMLLWPDSLLMNNQLGNKLLAFTQDETMGFGQIDLYDGSGSRNVSLGSSFIPDFGVDLNTGGLQLFSNDTLTLRLESQSGGGFLQIQNKQGIQQSFIGVETNNRPAMSLFNSDGDLSVKAESLESGEGNLDVWGTIHTKDQENKKVTEMNQNGLEVYSTNGNIMSGFAKSFGGNNSGGIVYANDKNGSLNFISGGNYLDDYTFGGLAAVYDIFGYARAGMKVNGLNEGGFWGNEFEMNSVTGNRRGILKMNEGVDAGAFYLYGPNNQLNVSLDYNEDSHNRGAVYIYNEFGEKKAGLFIRNITGMGELFADVKHFRMDHPEEDDKEIWYASLEGPEAGAYVRGTAHLKDGETFVEFPDHFKHVSNMESMTVQLTPLFWDTFGIAVIEKSEEGFRVKELKGGTGNFEFDWEVKCIRKGFEDYEVIHSK